LARGDNTATVAPKPYPREDAVQANIEDLRARIAKLAGMKPSDSIGASLIRELENEAFSSRLEKQ